MLGLFYQLVDDGLHDGERILFGRIERAFHHRAAHFGVEDVGKARRFVAEDLQRRAAVELIAHLVLLEDVFGELRVRHRDEGIQLGFRFDVRG